MDGPDRSGMWKTLKQRLGFKRMGCCGGVTWSPSSAAPTITIITESSSSQTDEGPDHDEEEERLPFEVGDVQVHADDDGARSQRVRPLPVVAAGMNLATALAAERSSRGSAAGHARAGRVKTLVRLIEETDGVDLTMARKRRMVSSGGGGGVAGESDRLCCVCMDRDKGAAFIPCGHTFCRVCSRELWVNRGSCPVCNRPILEILDIF